MEGRDEIGHADVKKTGGRDSQDEGNDVLHLSDGEVSERRAEERRGRRQRVIGECSCAGIAAVEENGKITDFLRNFMGDDSDCCRGSQLPGLQERGCDHYAVDKVVETVAYEDQRAGGVVKPTLGLMTMAPEEQFFKRKEDENSDKRGEHDRGCASIFQGSRKKAEEGAGEESSDGKTDEPRDEFLGKLPAREQKQRRRGDDTYAGDKGCYGN